MTGDKDAIKKGFSGLLDLASDISGINEPIKKLKSDEKLPVAKPLSQFQGEAALNQFKGKTTSYSPPTETLNSGEKSCRTGVGWILYLVYVVISFIVILAFLSYQKVDNDAQGSKKLSINPPSLSQSSSSRQTSSPSPPLLPVSSTSSVSEKSSVQPIRAAQQIEEAYVKYVYAMVNAINEGDFGQVSSFLLKGSPLWNSQIALVKNLSRKRITEKVIEAHVIEIRRLSENSMMLKTKETITIQYPSGKKSTKSYLWNYKAIFSGEYILFSDIEKSVSGPFPEAISSQQIEEVYVKYVYAMVNAINEGDFGQVSSFLLKGSPLWNSQIALVKNLSRKGITEKVNEAHVIEIRRLSENSMVLKTKETITIQYPSGKNSIKSYLWNYKATFSGGYILFSDIAKGSS